MKTLAPCVCALALTWALLAPAQAADAAGSAPADVSWKIHQTAPITYPPALINDGITRGEARVRVSLSETGQLLDALVIASSRPAFGQEALRVVKRWRYDAAKIKGESVGVVGDITFVFTVNGTIAIEKRPLIESEEAATISDPLAYGAVGLKRLDRIPTPTRVVPPVYPKEWSERGVKGAATVEFFIDETGQTRIPVVTVSDDDRLGASAVAAVAQWRFEPPIRQGQPVLTRAEQVFTFQPEKK